MTYMSSVIDLPLNKPHPIDVSIADMHELIIYLKTTTIYTSRLCPSFCKISR